jgi:hypothetical protein
VVARYLANKRVTFVESEEEEEEEGAWHHCSFVPGRLNDEAKL